MEQEDYFSQTNRTVARFFADESHTGFLDNVHYYNCTFASVSFTDIQLQHVIFDGCVLERCLFANVTAKKTKFINTEIIDTNFSNTNLYKDRFVNSHQYNVKFSHPQHGCKVDFDIGYSQKKVFLETFTCQLVILPVTILNALLLDKLGRVRLLGNGISKFSPAGNLRFYTNWLTLYRN